jgi:hypothetical protein
MTTSNLSPQSGGANVGQRGTISNGPDSGGTQWKEKLLDGTTVLIRPMADEDVELERRFIEQLSPQSRRFRFLGEIKTPNPELLNQLTQLGHASEAAFVA